jgi:hypothetical protein
MEFGTVRVCVSLFACARARAFVRIGSGGCETGIQGGESCAAWPGGEEGLGVWNPSADGSRV